MEQIFCRTGDCIASLRRAGAAQCDDSGRLPHRALLPLELRDYLSRMLPLLWMGMLFFLTFFTSAKARRAAALTDAAPMPPNRYALVRCGAALTGSLLLALLCMGEAAVFYSRMFDWHDWGILLLPTPDGPSAAPDIFPRERLAFGASAALAGVCVDGRTLPVYSHSPANRLGTV